MSRTRGRQTEKLPRKTEWRKKPIDRTKRVAPGCEIRDANIIHGTRKRKDYNYKLAFENYFLIDENENEQYVFPIQERRPRKSHNTTEKRIERYNPYDIESVKMINQLIKKSREERNGKKSKGRQSKKKVKDTKPKKEKVVEKKQEEEKVVEEEVVEEEKKQPKEVTPKQVEKKTTKTRRSSRRRSSKKKQPKELSSKVFQVLKDLGAVYSKRTARKYNKKVIPKAIQQFLDNKFPSGVALNVESLGLSNLQFTGEYTLPEDEIVDYDFLANNKDVILIGEGDYLVCALMSDLSSNFTVYIIDDDHPEKVKTTVKIYDLLKDSTLGEIPEEEEGDMIED